jgi:very-short-patch-repair endonuclease
MHPPLLLSSIVAVFVVVFLLLVVATAKKTRAGTVQTKAKAVLSRNEQAMYWRLRETFPDQVVLAQVAFSALITSRREHRNRYDRKVADFVVCDKSLAVLAVIELDDSSHAGRATQDGARSALLESAGYRVLRFPRVPDVEALRAQVQLQAPRPPKS